MSWREVDVIHCSDISHVFDNNIIEASANMHVYFQYNVI